VPWRCLYNLFFFAQSLALVVALNTHMGNRAAYEKLTPETKDAVLPTYASRRETDHQIAADFFKMVQAAINARQTPLHVSSDDGVRIRLVECADDDVLFCCCLPCLSLCGRMDAENTGLTHFFFQDAGLLKGTSSYRELNRILQGQQWTVSGGYYDGCVMTIHNGKGNWYSWLSFTQAPQTPK